MQLNELQLHMATQSKTWKVIEQMDGFKHELKGDWPAPILGVLANICVTAELEDDSSFMKNLLCNAADVFPDNPSLKKVSQVTTFPKPTKPTYAVQDYKKYVLENLREFRD